MKVSVRQLQVFEATARLSSYTLAAQELHLTQPAVSMQVRQFEEEVGLPLFEKLGKQVSLTEAGREIFQYCRSINRSLQEMEDVIESLKGVSRGRLCVAVTSTVNFFAPRLLAAFHKRYPNIGLRLDVAKRKRLVQQLQEDSVDLVLMGQPPEAVDVESDAFMENPLVVIAPPGHPLENEKQVPIERLAEEVFVIWTLVAQARMHPPAPIKHKLTGCLNGRKMPGVLTR